MENKSFELINELAKLGREIIRSYDVNFLERQNTGVAKHNFMVELQKFISIYHNDPESLLIEMKEHFHEMYTDIAKLIQNVEAFVALSGKELAKEDIPTIFAISKKNSSILDCLSRDFWIETGSHLLNRPENERKEIKTYLKNRAENTYFGIDEKTLNEFKKNGLNFNLIEDLFIENIMNVNLYKQMIKFDFKFESEDQLDINSPKEVYGFMDNILLGLSVGFAYIVYLDGLLSKYTGNYVTNYIEVNLDGK
ncbi:hypothetical protein [Spiroplasma endosymbiont of Labia minor]|uniref:hypothetical protein n=1 Tax=Spiroplasma endosymbiont of Labia minor TaxID=3066305 RepID=UPI0030CABCAD